MIFLAAGHPSLPPPTHTPIHTYIHTYLPLSVYLQRKEKDIERERERERDATIFNQFSTKIVGIDVNVTIFLVFYQE